MSLVNLDIHPRTTGGKNANRRTRAGGRIPGVVYGKGRPTELVELDDHAFKVTMGRLAGRSAIFSLNRQGRGEETIALLREVQRHPVSDQILHIDLMEIPRDMPVTVAVHLEVVGDCRPVRMNEATLSLSMDSIEISCRPIEMPEAIRIDVTGLEIHDKIFAKDVKLPVGELISDPDQLVLNIKPMAIFVEEVPAEGEAAAVEGAEGAAEAAADAEKKD